MRDYYQDGYNTGRGRDTYNYDNDYPKTDYDSYQYRQGLEEGRRREEISRELDREMYGAE